MLLQHSGEWAISSGERYEIKMAFFIGSECIDTKDRSCIEVCPVDCIYEGNRKLYINPRECIDCGACEPACPMQAISLASSSSDEEDQFVEDNHAFFSEPLEGRDAPIGDPGGAAMIGPIGKDTPLVTTFGS